MRIYIPILFIVKSWYLKSISCNKVRRLAQAEFKISCTCAVYNNQEYEQGGNKFKIKRPKANDFSSLSSSTLD